jgi:hypothetical protein
MSEDTVNAAFGSDNNTTTPTTNSAEASCADLLKAKWQHQRPRSRKISLIAMTLVAVVIALAALVVTLSNNSDSGEEGTKSISGNDTSRPPTASSETAPVVPSPNRMSLSSSPLKAPSLLSPTTRQTLAPGQSRAVAVTNFINGISLLELDGGITLTVPMSFTPFNVLATISAEQAALSWLVFEDPLQFVAQWYSRASIETTTTLCPLDLVIASSGF